jgi:hypothetical protein
MKDFEAAELIIKSELNEITRRNKIIKIADRHGWDVVKEYYIPHLADDNEDAVKLRMKLSLCLFNAESIDEFSKLTWSTLVKSCLRGASCEEPCAISPALSSPD